MIHITLVRTDIDDLLLARMTEALSPAEQARAARFRHVADRRRHVVARTVLKGLLAERLGCEADDVTVISGVHGKPGLAQAARAPTHELGTSISPDVPLHFNLSHSGDLALIAIAPVPVGIDLERDTPADAQDLAQAWFTPVEQERLARGEDDFLTLWTAREAVLKAEGIGLSANPWAFSVPPLSSSASTAPVIISPPFVAVQAAPGYAAFDGFLVARIALDAALPGNAAPAPPPALLAPYRAAIALRGSPLPVSLACTDAARFAMRATLPAVAPASVDAVCLPH